MFGTTIKQTTNPCIIVIVVLTFAKHISSLCVFLHEEAHRDSRACAFNR